MSSLSSASEPSVESSGAAPETAPTVPGPEEKIGLTLDGVLRSQLVPDGPNRYFYSYDEKKLRCAPDAPPSRRTPRVGYVEVVR